MNAEQNAVLENVQAPVGPIAPATPATDLNTQQLPGIAQPTDAEKATLVAKLAAEAKAKEETALARFDTNVGFKLEGQVIGQAVKKKVSKTGAVSVRMGSLKDLGPLSGGLKGDELKYWARMRSDELKGKQSEMAARLAGDNGWTGGAVTLSAKGDKITLEYKKASPVTVGVKAPPTDDEIAKLWGISVSELKAFKEQKAKDAVQALIDAEEKKLQEQLEAEQAAIAKEAAKNGHIAPEAPEATEPE